MSNIDIIWVMIAFVCYLAMMLIIGVVYMKKTKGTEDFFLGGRGLNGWVAALSAQASDMSGWLLMGLPGTVYALGTGQSWIAIGLLLGTIFNWVFVSKRLRRYTIRANNALTLPEYFTNRFHDKGNVLLLTSSVVIVIYFLLYTASALSAGGKLFSNVFGFDYKVSLTVGAFVILAYTFMGGFMAVCVTDFIQGTLMLIGIMIVPIIAYIFVGPSNVMSSLSNSGVDSAIYMNLFKNGDKSFGIIDIISQLGWGLGYCGMPHILTRFMAIKDEKELKKSRKIAIIWVTVSLLFAIVIGVIGRAYLGNSLDGGKEENVFIQMIIQIFTKDINLALIGGLFLCGILAAIMSTADSQLLVTASSVSEDIYHRAIDKNASDKKVLMVSRITVLVVAVLAYIIALNPNSKVMDLVSSAWAGLGAAFGPTVLLSLYWKKTNLHGAVVGIISGAATVLVWEYIPIVSGKTLATATGLYSLVVAFAISFVLTVIVSSVMGNVSEEMIKEYNDVVEGNIAE